MSATDFGERAPGWVPDLTLERRALGELALHDAQRLEEQLASDERLRERVRALDRSSQEIGDAFPAHVMARRAVERVRQLETAPKARAVNWLVPASLAAMLAIIVVATLVGPDASTSTSSPSPDHERQKGPAAALTIYRNTTGGSEMLSDNSVAHGGDVIRLAYRMAAPGWGAIVSVDGRGLTTIHLPAGGDSAIALQSGRSVLLDKAFELDDAPVMERFYLITAAHEFELAPIIDAIRRAADSDVPARLAIPSSFTVTTFSLRKDRRP